MARTPIPAAACSPASVLCEPPEFTWDVPEPLSMGIYGGQGTPIFVGIFTDSDLGSFATVPDGWSVEAYTFQNIPGAQPPTFEPSSWEPADLMGEGVLAAQIWGVPGEGTAMVFVVTDPNGCTAVYGMAMIPYPDPFEAGVPPTAGVWRLSQSGNYWVEAMSAWVDGTAAGTVWDWNYTLGTDQAIPDQLLFTECPPEGKKSLPVAQHPCSPPLRTTTPAATLKHEVRVVEDGGSVAVDPAGLRSLTVEVLEGAATVTIEGGSGQTVPAGAKVTWGVNFPGDELVFGTQVEVTEGTAVVSWTYLG